jgi:hypothetical protein
MTNWFQRQALDPFVNLSFVISELQAMTPASLKLK